MLGATLLLASITAGLPPQPFDDRVLLARGEKNKLHLAGRCAGYQVDPACQNAANVWYSLKAEPGK